MAASQLVERSLLMGLFGLLLSSAFAANDKSGLSRMDSDESDTTTYDPDCTNIGGELRKHWKYNCKCPGGTRLRSHPERFDTTDCDAGQPEFTEEVKFQVFEIPGASPKAKFQVFQASDVPSPCECRRLYVAPPPTAAEKAQAEAAKLAEEKAEAAKVAENDVLRARNDVLTGQKDVLKGQNDVLKGQNDVLKGQNDVLKGQNDVLQAKSDVAEAEAEKIAEEEAEAAKIADEKAEAAKKAAAKMAEEAVALAKQTEQDEKKENMKAKLQDVVMLYAEIPSLMQKLDAQIGYFKLLVGEPGTRTPVPATEALSENPIFDPIFEIMYGLSDKINSCATSIRTIQELNDFPVLCAAPDDKSLQRWSSTMEILTSDIEIQETIVNKLTGVEMGPSMVESVAKMQIAFVEASIRAGRMSDAQDGFSALESSAMTIRSVWQVNVKGADVLTKMIRNL